jgi:acyl-phosphate glycerol 3-phosphate acyltransferase
MLILFLLSLASYLLGAVPFGWLVARARGVDIIKHGSGNIGATNVGRVLGKKYGVLVFALDFAKGALPVAVASLLPVSEVPSEALKVMAGVAAFLGHLFPVYLKFRGGKGVATGAGVVAVLLPLPALVALLTWVVVVFATRYVSVASICAAASLCVAHVLLAPRPWAYPENIVSTFCFLAAALVAARHAGNLRRLLGGTEHRLKESGTMMLFSKTLHVLALGLWFGSAVFFTLAGYLIFEEFKKDVAAAEQKGQWPEWFVLPDGTRDTANTELPDLLRRERASRAFGVAVRPLFPWYYGIQLVCGFLAYGTALAWQRGREKDRVQSWRSWLLMVAVIVTLGGWWLEGKVEELRKPRDEKTDLVLRMHDPTKEQIDGAERARDEFMKWHGYSLMQNVVTLLLVTVAMALAAQLPTAPGGPAAGPSEERKAASDQKAPAAV